MKQILYFSMLLGSFMLIWLVFGDILSVVYCIDRGGRDAFAHSICSALWVLIPLGLAFVILPMVTLFTKIKMKVKKVLEWIDIALLIMLILPIFFVLLISSI